MINSTSGDQQKDLVKMVKKVTQNYSNEKDYKFASKLVNEFKLNRKEFPELQILTRSKHPLVDKAFLQPNDPNFIPLSNMEEILKGAEYLFGKLFFSLIRHN